MKQMEGIDLFKLREYLPSGYSKILQERLRKKTGKTYTRAYIRKCLTLKHYKLHIVEEAMKYVEENELQKEYIQKQLNRM